MPAKAPLLKLLRSVHLYIGAFTTPAILFFAFTGAIQTFGLHETNRDHPDYKPARWVAVLGQLHKKQSPVLPARRAGRLSRRSPFPSQLKPRLRRGTRFHCVSFSPWCALVCSRPRLPA